MHRIEFFGPTSAAAIASRLAAFRVGMNDLGYAGGVLAVESSYVAIIMVSAMGETGILLVFVPSLFLIMLLVLETGRRIGKRYYSMEESDHHRGNRILVESAIYGLLGLLIAFTVSGAANRFDARRTLTVQEANAIGTAYLRLDLLPAAAQPELRRKFRRYAEARLAVFRLLPDFAASNAEAVRANELQRSIWNEVIAALPGVPQSATLMLLPALNEMFDITSSRAIAGQAHTPLVILCALAVLALFCCLLAGYGLAGENPLGSALRMIGFALIVTLTIFVILDLDYPRVGLIRLDYADQALIDVLAGMR
jgi:hypothetical protein